MRTYYPEIYTHNYYVSGDPVDEMRTIQLQEDGETSIPILPDRLFLESFEEAATRTEGYAKSLADMLACEVTTEVRGSHLYVQVKES